jgi:hypothetical protein
MFRLCQKMQVILVSFFGTKKSFFAEIDFKVKPWHELFLQMTLPTSEFLFETAWQDCLIFCHWEIFSYTYMYINIYNGRIYFVSFVSYLQYKKYSRWKLWAQFLLMLGQIWSLFQNRSGHTGSKLTNSVCSQKMTRKYCESKNTSICLVNSYALFYKTLF